MNLFADELRSRGQDSAFRARRSTAEAGTISFHGHPSQRNVKVRRQRFCCQSARRRSPPVDAQRSFDKQAADSEIRPLPRSCHRRAHDVQGPPRDLKPRPGATPYDFPVPLDDQAPVGYPCGSVIHSAAFAASSLCGGSCNGGAHSRTGSSRSNRRSRGGKCLVPRLATASISGATYDAGSLRTRSVGVRFSVVMRRCNAPKSNHSPAAPPVPRPRRSRTHGIGAQVQALGMDLVRSLPSREKNTVRSLSCTSCRRGPSHFSP